MLMEHADPTGPGKPMRMMANMLAGRGLEVRSLDDDESRRLIVIDARHVRCKIDVEDDQSIVWEYDPPEGGDTEPAELSAMALRLLDAHKTLPETEPGLHPRAGVSLKGAVRHDIRAHGLKASLAVYEDEEAYDVITEVVLVNPAKPERGLVRVTDDGFICWECDYGEMTDGATAIVDTTADALALFKPRHDSAD
jgi:hypothetical protein